MKELFTTKRILIFTLLGTVFLISVVLFILSTADYRAETKKYGELSHYISANDLILEGNETSVEMTTELPYAIDWNTLYQTNPDIVGWIVIPGTNINYPVVQTSDNDYYVSHAFDHTKNAAACPFLDCENFPDFSDYNSIIYGHNMRNGSMFADLNKYQDEAYYNEHKKVYLLTPSWQREYQIISVHVAIAGKESYEIPKDEDAFSLFLERELSERNYDTGVKVSDASVLTLSTCYGHRTNKRTVVVCQPVAEFVP